MDPMAPHGPAFSLSLLEEQGAGALGILLLAFSRINSFFRRYQTIEVKVDFGSPPSQENCLLSLSCLHVACQEGNKSHTLQTPGQLPQGEAKFRGCPHQAQSWQLGTKRPISVAFPFLLPSVHKQVNDRFIDLGQEACRPRERVSGAKLAQLELCRRTLFGYTERHGIHGTTWDK